MRRGSPALRRPVGFVFGSAAVALFFCAIAWAAAVAPGAAPAPGAVSPPGVAPAPNKDIPPVTAMLRLRMGNKSRILLYPPTHTPETPRAPVLFFCGEFGWRPLQQLTAQRLNDEGRYVVGIESPEYFNRLIEPSDWEMDLEKLKGFVNEKAGKPAGSAILLLGFHFGGELIPYMLNRGGDRGFAGALLISPDQDGTAVYRTSTLLRLPQPAEERFSVAEEIRRMPNVFPVVMIEGALDTESTAKALVDLVPGPHKYVSIPGGNRQFAETRDAFFSMVTQALTWLEGARGGADAGAARPGPAPAGPGH